MITTVKLINTESIQPGTMKNRDICWRRYKKHCTQDNDASVPLKVGTLGPHTVLSVAISCPVTFAWTSLMVWNFFPFNGDFSLGKSQKSHGTKSGLQRGWVTWVIWCFTKISAQDMMHEWVRCCDKAANHQLPIAAAFWIIHIVSVEECSSLTQNLMQIHCSTCSVILHVTAAQYTCSLSGICCPHWLEQWSHHCSQMCIPVHSPRLPGYTDVMQTIPIGLTKVGLLPDRPLTPIPTQLVVILYVCHENTWALLSEQICSIQYIIIGH